jgi:hypothetical protein
MAGLDEPRRQPRLVFGFVDDGETCGGIVCSDEKKNGVGAYIDGCDRMRSQLTSWM